MPRRERTKSGTGIYHVMLRGINRQDIFEDAEDYLQMVACLRMITVPWFSISKKSISDPKVNADINMIANYIKELGTME